jgi:hypothetical protein
MRKRIQPACVPVILDTRAMNMLQKLFTSTPWKTIQATYHKCNCDANRTILMLNGEITEVVSELDQSMSRVANNMAIAREETRAKREAEALEMAAFKLRMQGI